MLSFCLLLAAIADRGLAAPFTAANAAWNVNLETAHVPEKYYGDWPGHEYHPSPPDWRALTIYQLLTDRFADGDPSNNELHAGGFDVRDMAFRHGGDFVGLMHKLPYIKGLGCDAIWISPIFQNGFNKYHQYAMQDLTLVDKRLGTLEELRNLTTAAHKLGMYVIIDVVMNHMDNLFFFEDHEHSSAPFRMHEDGGLREYKVVPRLSEEEMFDTPAGKQPYIDFWYNNTWDPDAQYAGPVYGQWGEAAYDGGHGTYDGSDFHHNGDLQDFYKPFEIHFGKIYGVMDDLRLEHQRVQDKYIAMTKALIASADVDGFRVDTPMQVPLPFFKKWAPAMRDFAKSLGKERFGMFGEFYVTPARYSTMTGRGKDLTMWDNDRFIEGPATLKGGIVYSYYWYTFSAMVHNMSGLSDGLPLAYKTEANMLDLYDPMSGRQEYAMWNFCNNHDNWRLQVMTGSAQMRMCLAVITFWPGVPLHYAGDEQDFNTPGSALDGWAREELGVSMAWRAVRTADEGNPADFDNFDMTTGSYRYIQRLNALRRAYFQGFGKEECDVIVTPDPAVTDVLVFTRGCTPADRVTLMANFRANETRVVNVKTPWAEGMELTDILAITDPVRQTAGAEGSIEVTLPPLGVLVFAEGEVRLVPPSATSVLPAHGSVVTLHEDELHVEVTFDRPMLPSAASSARVDGRGDLFKCFDDDCAVLVAKVPQGDLDDGIHHIEVDEGIEAQDGAKMFSSFRSTFVVARQPSIISRPGMSSQRGLICNDHASLCHNAPGADLFRVQNVGDDSWSAWQTVDAESEWKSRPGRPVLVQYHAEGSSSYIVGDCVASSGEPCHTSWHSLMYARGDFNEWGEKNDGRMGLVGDFTWGLKVQLSGYAKAKFAPGMGWAKAYGSHSDRELLYNLPDYDERSKVFDVQPYMSGSEASRRWMEARGLWSEHEALASGAEFAKELWIGSGCTAKAPFCPVPDNGKWTCVGFTRPEQNMDWCRTQGIVNCVEYAENDNSPEMESCGPCSCCRRKVTPVLTGPEETCCVLFNDLFLNYTVTSDLSKCPDVVIVDTPTPGDSSAATSPSGSPKSSAAAPACDPESPTQVVDPAVSATLQWTTERLLEAERDFNETGFERMPSPANWHNEVAYSVIVDRFANGDIKNDRLNLPDYQQRELKDGQAYSVANWRHGGDLLGIRGRLTYLRDMGVTIVGISPIFWNGQGEYHGSCTSDPTKVDPGFGDARLLRELVHDAHALGLRVVLDVDVNHACGRGLQYSDGLPQVEHVVRCVYSQADAYWNDTRGDPIPEKYRHSLSWGKDLHESLRHQSFFARCGPRSLYYQGGKAFEDMSAEDTDKKILQAGNLFMDDSDHNYQFNTMDVGFQQVYTNLMKYWIAYADIDGLRVSSAGRVSTDFTAYFATHLRHYAQELGKDNFHLVAQLDLDGDKLAPQQMGFMQGMESTPFPAKTKGAIAETCSLLPDNGMSGFLASFPAPETFHMRDLAVGEDPYEFYSKPKWTERVSKVRSIYDASGADLQATWNAFESKNTPRLLATLDDNDANDAWRLQVGLAWSMTWYGVPEIFMGAEMGFNGRCFANLADRHRIQEAMFSEGWDEKAVEEVLSGCDFSMRGSGVADGYFRQDMFIGGPMMLGSAIAAVQEHAHIGNTLMGAGGPHWCEDPLIDRENDIYRLTRAMIRIRRSCPALRTAKDQAVEVIAAPLGELAYWKLDPMHDGGSPQAMLVVLKFADVPDATMASYKVPEDLAFTEGQAFVDLLNPARMAMVVDKSGVLTLIVPDHLDPSHVSIFAPNDFAAFDTGGDWMVCSGVDLPSLPETVCYRQDGELFLTWGGFSLVGLLVMAVFCLNARSNIFLSVVGKPTTPTCPQNAKSREVPEHVLTAAIEHTIPERGVKVSAGGLGKVLDQMLREHPEGILSLVHPMFGDVDYGELDFFMNIHLYVDGKEIDVKVRRMESECETESGGVLRRVWYLLDHEWFQERKKRAPYPAPMTKLVNLRYFSLWNQCVAKLIEELQPTVYHCMDYHAALAPLYLVGEFQRPTILVLHNADYMGIIETDFINDRFWKTVSALRRLSLVFNLKQSTIRRYAMFEGRFNMLRAGITYIKETQAGQGVCAVSANYAAELKRERPLFNGLPTIMPLDNATDPADDQGRTGIDTLKKQRFAAMKELQAYCGLDQDPDARILIFIGRWVKQKGVDHIAMLTSTLLETHPEVQIILAGPPDDACGLYAQELLAELERPTPRYPGRLCVRTEFFALPGELRRGAHLCFTPSCSEPFGYVDVEFGLLGVPSVGCAIGGLGKMPGVYFRQQNSDSSQMLLEAFLCSVDFALNMNDADYWEMAHAATTATFPFETWRANLLEAYWQARENFKKREGEDLTLNDQWHENPAMDVIRNELATRKQSAFRWKSAAARVAQQMQVLDVDDNMEFLTQSVSEERVHDIMKEAMKSNQQRGSYMVKDAETLQRYICLAEQRLTERSHVTQWLMKPFFRTKYLRIHAVIALCYIMSPAGETLLKTTKDQQSEFLTDYLQHSIFYAGLALGSLMWLCLSRSIPPNLLMASSQLANVLFSVLVPSMLDSWTNDWTLASFLALSGVLSSSRMLFIIWNFNEDFHGGFQVGCKRIGVLESLRTAVGMLMMIVSMAELEYPYTQVIQLVVSLTTLIMLFKAPHCYCSYSLPPMGWFEGMFTHKTFILLFLSEFLNQCAGFTSHTYHDWWVLNGWSTEDIIHFSMAIMFLSFLLLPLIFIGLTRASVWGPWPMRDFTCLLPPGSLLRALALYDIGYLHHRSALFAWALIASYCIDVIRNASMFASMMTILGNKWYALKGCYLVLLFTSAASCASPYIGKEIALAAVNASPFDRLTLNQPVTDHTGSLADAVFMAVVPLTLAAYACQLLAWVFFSSDIPTYGGHGNLLADGSVTGSNSTMHRVPISALKRMRKAAKQSRIGWSCFGPCRRRFGKPPADAISAKEAPCADGLEEGGHQAEAHSDVFSQYPTGLSKPPSHAGWSKPPSHAGFSKPPSKAGTEMVSEIEQQILLNLAERQVSAAPSHLPSRCSSLSRLPSGNAGESSAADSAHAHPARFAPVPSAVFSVSDSNASAVGVGSTAAAPSQVITLPRRESSMMSSQESADSDNSPSNDSHASDPEGVGDNPEHKFGDVCEI